MGSQRGNDLLQVQATIHLAHIHAARGDSGLARLLLKGLEAGIQSPALLRQVQNAQALIAIRANDFSSLEWWVKIVTSDSQNTLPVQKEGEAFTLARLCIAQGKISQALEILGPWKMRFGR